MYHHNLGEQIEGLFASLPVCILFLLDFRLQVFDFCFSPWWKFPHQPGHPMRYEVGWWNGEIWGVKTGWNLPAFCWSKKKGSQGNSVLFKWMRIWKGPIKESKQIFRAFDKTTTNPHLITLLNRAIQWKDVQHPWSKFLRIPTAALDCSQTGASSIVYPYIPPKEIYSWIKNQVSRIVWHLWGCMLGTKLLYLWRQLYYLHKAPNILSNLNQMSWL